MADGRRHSVDIPISKALLALRRVKSLRDPTTNSLSKFLASNDDLNWETISNDGISLKVVTGCQEDKLNKDRLSLSKKMHIDEKREEHVGGCEFYCGLTTPDPDVVTLNNPDLSQCSSDKKEIFQNKCLSERYCTDKRKGGWDLACITPPGNYLEDVDSCNEPIVGSKPLVRREQALSRWKLRHKEDRIKSSAVAGDVMSRVSSPSLSESDALLENLSHSSSFADDGVEIDCSSHGCGIRCCWSRAPRFQESDFLSDLEDRPLLSSKVAGTPLLGQKRGLISVGNEAVLFSESPKSLNKRFRPKSFSDLVGQTVVARSLLSAILNRKVTSFYLFHGPRGTGKTSAARIFAAALNCLSLEGQRPCGLCEECVCFFSGQSRDIREVDSVRLNRTDRVRTLIKNAVTPPISSQYKVFLVDECQLLQGETWVTFLSCLEELPHHAVFIMIGTDLGKLPKGAVSRSQRFHFLKIKEADITSRLEKICIEEGLDFDQAALDFIAAKANGSLRDAEMVLDQLSLLGKRITVSLAHELIGVVPDDELLELLDLALSSDTSNTVRRARELMRSRIDPMQLISQLANLIMDILAGTYQNEDYEAKRKIFGRCTSEAEQQKLSHALKVLSEAEKQLRSSKNQTTWLTVALLQLSSVDAPTLDTNDSMMSPPMMVGQNDSQLHCTSSTGKILKDAVSSACDNSKSHKFRIDDSYNETLDSIWRRAAERCQSISLKNFLKKEGRLSSVCTGEGLAIVELEFRHPDYVARAEKSWKVIAGLLQSTLNCNVEIRINLVPVSSILNSAKGKKLSFSFFSCSRGMQQNSQSTTGSDRTDYSDKGSEQAMVRDKPIDTCSSNHGPHASHIYHHRSNAATTIRDAVGNALSTEATIPSRSSQESVQKGLGSRNDSTEQIVKGQCHILFAQEPEHQPSCFSKSVRLHSSNTSQIGCLGSQSQSRLALSLPKKTSFDTHLHANDDSYNLCSGTSNFVNNTRDVDRKKSGSKVHCWDALTCHPRKVGLAKQQGQRSHLARWVLPCAAAK